MAWHLFPESMLTFINQISKNELNLESERQQLFVDVICKMLAILFSLHAGEYMPKWNLTRWPLGDLDAILKV